MGDDPAARCCTKCRRSKPVEQFNLAPRGPDGRTRMCTMCLDRPKRARAAVVEPVRRDPAGQLPAGVYVPITVDTDWPCCGGEIGPDGPTHSRSCPGRRTVPVGTLTLVAPADRGEDAARWAGLVRAEAAEADRLRAAAQEAHDRLAQGDIQGALALLGSTLRHAAKRDRGAPPWRHADLLVPPRIPPAGRVAVSVRERVWGRSQRCPDVPEVPDRSGATWGPSRGSVTGPD